jgi:hypothetical protein
MSIIPIITFKAGMCDVDVGHLMRLGLAGECTNDIYQQTTRPYKVTPVELPGYIYLYMGEDGT